MSRTARRSPVPGDPRAEADAEGAEDLAEGGVPGALEFLGEGPVRVIADEDQQQGRARAVASAPASGVP
jgi:hypothetical protein